MKAKFFILLSVLFLLTACSDFTAPERFKDAQYTLSGLLIGGKTIDLEHPIIIGKTVKLNDLNSPDMFVATADIKVTEMVNSAVVDTFHLAVLNFQLPDMPDTVSIYVDPHAHIIAPEHTYRMDVRIPIGNGNFKTLWAETTVPRQNELIPDFNHLNVNGQGYSLSENLPYPKMRYDRIDLDYPVAMKTNGIQNINFLVELYCLEEFSTDLEFTTSFMGQEHPPADMESNYYASSGETIRRIQFLGNYQSRQFEDGNYYVRLSDYRLGFIFFGKYQVNAYSVDDNYYYYKFMPEGYFYGGVHNANGTKAAGCLGSMVGGKMFTEVVKSY